MKEHRELQTLIDQLEAHIKAQAAEIERLSRDAELIRADEREACAALCDDWFAATAGAAIRERGKIDPAFKNYMGNNWAGIV